MKKIELSKLLVIFILVLAMCLPIFSYAIDEDIEETETFFSVDKTEASIGETLTLNLNLDMINYENFEFILTSNSDLQDINTEEEVNTEVEENELRIIANKSELDISTIIFYYNIPETLEVGNEITLQCVVKEYVEADENGTETETETQEVTIVITVAEKQDDEDNTETESNTENQSNQQENDQVSEMTENKQTSASKESSTSVVQTSESKSNTNVSDSSNQEENTYNGESNNYLSSLVVDGYDITPEFSKTNNTYFLTVSEDTTSVKITATFEDENAKVNIYGNDDLQDGENKILIFVTAENGNVKIYRIYVTK